MSRREGVVILMFILEALCRRVYRVSHLLISLSPSQPLAAIDSYNNESSFQFFSLFCVCPGKFCFATMSSTALSDTLFLYVVFGQGANGTLFLVLLDVTVNLGFPAKFGSWNFREMEAKWITK